MAFIRRQMAPLNFMGQWRSSRAQGMNLAAACAFSSALHLGANLVTESDFTTNGETAHFLMQARKGGRNEGMRVYKLSM